MAIVSAGSFRITVIETLNAGKSLLSSSLIEPAGALAGVTAVVGDALLPLDAQPATATSISPIAFIYPLATRA
jgi:hypothetical protein